MPKRAKGSCPAKILDAAETAFADDGYNGASMRDVLRGAGVNLAAIYYYFGSKKGLMEAVLKRRFGPLRQEHLEILRQLNAMLAPHVAGGKNTRSHAIAAAGLVAAPAAKRQAAITPLGRIVTEPDAHTQEILRTQRSEVRAAFLKALRASLPQALAVDLQWRMEFVWGALAFILCNPRTIAVETHGACNPIDASKVLAEMIDFFSAGFRAAANRVD